LIIIVEFIILNVDKQTFKFTIQTNPQKSHCCNDRATGTDRKKLHSSDSDRKFRR